MPSADATTNAADAAMNTVSLLTSLSDANNMIANCVLSPNSATKTAANIARNTFNSIHKLSSVNHNVRIGRVRTRGHAVERIFKKRSDI